MGSPLFLLGDRMLVFFHSGELYELGITPYLLPLPVCGSFLDRS